jgi:hypothetical protein
LGHAKCYRHSQEEGNHFQLSEWRENGRHFELDSEGWTGFEQIEMRVWLSGWKDYAGKVKRWRSMN